MTDASSDVVKAAIFETKAKTCKNFETETSSNNPRPRPESSRQRLQNLSHSPKFSYSSLFSKISSPIATSKLYVCLFLRIFPTCFGFCLTVNGLTSLRKLY